MAFGGGGFFGSGADQSENNSAQGSAGAQSQTGSPLALNLSAGDDIKGVDLTTNLTVNTEMTDFGAIESALKFASDAAMEVFSAITKTTGDAVGLAGDAVLSQQALAGLAIENNTKLAYDNVEAMRNLAVSNNQLLSDISGENISFLDSLSNNVFDGLFGVVEGMTEASKEQQTQNLEILSRATESALDKVFIAGQSDAERITENFMKYALAAVVVIIALVLLSGVVKK